MGLVSFLLGEHAYHSRHAASAFLERAQCQERGNAAQYCSNSPGMIKACGNRQRSAQEDEHEPCQCACGPRGVAYKLRAGTVVFDSHEKTAGAKQPTAHLQIPA